MFDLSEVVMLFNLLIYKYLISPRSFAKSGMTHVLLIILHKIHTQPLLHTAIGLTFAKDFSPTFLYQH
jgi:hypothetical protein